MTGGSAGIGLAVARSLAADGWWVTAVARDGARLRAAVAQVDGVTAHPADATDPNAIAEAVHTHLERTDGVLDLVVASAGTGSAGSAADISASRLRAMIELNLEAVFALATASIPAMRRTDPNTPPAWFVVVSSLSGIWPTPGFAGYSATKAAALSLARSIAADEADNGVRGCAICPAFVETAMSDWARDRIDGPMLSPDDVAAAVRFLTGLSPAASVTEIVLRRAGAAPFEP